MSESNEEEKIKTKGRSLSTCCFGKMCYVYMYNRKESFYNNEKVKDLKPMKCYQ